MNNLGKIFKIQKNVSVFISLFGKPAIKGVIGNEKLKRVALKVEEQ
jgi:hypothetical protein